MACHRPVPGGLVVAVRLTPRAARDSIDGVGRLADGSEVLQVRVRAVPAEGAANRALVLILSKALKVPKSAVAIVAGGAARLKQVRIEGDPTSLSHTIETWRRVQ